MTEHDILRHINRQPHSTFDQLLSKISRDVGFLKPGTKEKLEDIIGRRCDVTAGGIVKPKL